MPGTEAPGQPGRAVSRGLRPSPHLDSQLYCFLAVGKSLPWFP